MKTRPLRKIAMGLLLVGAVAGYASALRSSLGGCRLRHEERRAAFEQRIADTCASAAARELHTAPQGSR